MREILFRGKTNYEGRDSEWLYGSLLAESQNTFPIIARDYDNDEEWIGIIEWGTVDPETVGQYTGLTDKNGKKIFEGDIVKFDDMLGIINFGFGCYCVKTNKPDWKCRNNPAIDIIFNEYPQIEIIGNIHDNPELLN